MRLSALLGSVAQHAVVRSPVPVLTVRQDDRPVRVRCILAPTDFSPAADAALPWVDLLARTFDTRLVLLHLVEVPWVGEAIARQLEERARAELQTRAQRLPPCETLVRAGLGSGLSPQRIVEAAADVNADLVKMGTTGARGWTASCSGARPGTWRRPVRCPC